MGAGPKEQKRKGIAGRGEPRKTDKDERLDDDGSGIESMGLALKYGCRGVCR